MTVGLVAGQAAVSGHGRLPGHDTALGCLRHGAGAPTTRRWGAGHGVRSTVRTGARAHATTRR